MNGPTSSWRRPGLFIGSAAAAVAAVGLCAVPASAHTPHWSVDCSQVTVDLAAYNGKVTNTVSVTVDGKDLLATKTFGSTYHDNLTLPEHDKALTVHLVVKAGDGDQYNVDQTKTAPVCASTPPATPTPSETSKPSPTPTKEVPSATASASEAAPVPSSKPSASDLAETGSSSSTPIIAGAAAVVVVAGGGILLATRKRNAARH
ncbi:LAETG motif-containing sortase-dependent surface protein [Streptomyces odontomachi]|uniref:LAETG motif-containing sortase-dependent surface protein n=1 Tax=Streptomyces odontomachi TaxID=2944940 RepID=UPI00210B13F3|nr:LAETG motif-containing sortase-dependent surface protein [Streptomyces sp. ODS25]